MAITNWTTETATDPVSGKTTVIVTVYDPISRPIQSSWISGAPPLTAPVGGAANAQLGHADVLAESVVAGQALLAQVNAGAVVAGDVVIANPDPTEQ